MVGTQARRRAGAKPLVPRRCEPGASVCPRPTGFPKSQAASVLRVRAASSLMAALGQGHVCAAARQDALVGRTHMSAPRDSVVGSHWEVKAVAVAFSEL